MSNDASASAVDGESSRAELLDDVDSAPLVRDRSWLQGLLSEHQAGIWRYLRFLGCDASLAEDLLQETFLKVWKRPFEERSREASAAYLRAVARSLYLKQIRRDKKRTEILANLKGEEIDAVWSEYVGADEGLAYRAALRECLAALPEKSQEAIQLFYRDGSSREDVAAALDMRMNGVKSLLRRARERLRECVERKLRRAEHEE